MEAKKRRDAIKPGQCCTLIYTSGTTGAPKAVMMSHDNITWTSRIILEHAKSLKKDGSAHATVSYLPLSHIAAQLLDIFLPICATAIYSSINEWEIYYARPDALKGTLSNTLKVARPTVFFGVPRVWEKIQEAIIKKAKANPMSSAKLMLINWLKSINIRAYYARQLDGNMIIPFGYSLAETILVSKVKSNLGFDRIQFTASGAAPIYISTLEFWAGLGINIIEGYGMSESCGLHTLATPYHCKIGTVGPPFNGVTTLLVNDPDRDKRGNGEICMRGRHVMMGYMYDIKKTKGAIDSEGPSTSSPPTSLSPTKAISPLAADEKDIIRIDKKDFNKLINKIELLLHLEELIYFEFQGVTLNAANVYDGENTEHMANKVFKNDVMLKYERRNNIKYSQ
eukprot:777453_1